MGDCTAAYQYSSYSCTVRWLRTFIYIFTLCHHQTSLCLSHLSYRATAEHTDSAKAARPAISLQMWEQIGGKFDRWRQHKWSESLSYCRGRFTFQIPIIIILVSICHKTTTDNEIDISELFAQLWGAVRKILFGKVLEIFWVVYFKKNSSWMNTG